MENFNQYSLVYKHKNFSKKKVISLKNIAYRSFYLRIKTIYILLNYIKKLIKNPISFLTSK